MQSDPTELHWLMEMLHNIDVGLVVFDSNYQIQIWNGFMENHSGLLPREAKGKILFDLFPEIDKDWFTRKADSVFLLKSKAFTIWEQRPYLFKFKNYRSITGTVESMYQNTTLIPLTSSTGVVDNLCLIVYDVTDIASHKLELEAANEELSILSKTDRLTQIFNRGHWEECLRTEFKRYTRGHNLSSLLMLDIDHFKRVNDGYGHQAGDDCIKALADTITQCIRETDIAGRYGGEEFAVLLPDTTAEEALVLAERIRVTIENLTVQHNDIDINFTISLGIAEISESFRTYEAWIECADASLFQSKETGRNKITIYNI